MATWDELRSELDVALNEADLLGLEVDAQRRIAAATFRVLTLPPDGSPSDDSRVQMLFRPVGRGAASLRKGCWDDASAEVIPFRLADLLSVVQSFGGRPIYGWEFFDRPQEELAHWGDRLSLDWRSGAEGLSRSIRVFQSGGEGPPRHLDVCVWFDELAVRRPDGVFLALEEFAAAGKRWWDAFNAGDQRTAGHGLFPLNG